LKNCRQTSRDASQRRLANSRRFLAGAALFDGLPGIRGFIWKSLAVVVIINPGQHLG
jgi:hypothetical protein